MTSTEPQPPDTVAAMLADLDSITPGPGGRVCRPGSAIDTLPDEVRDGFLLVEARATTTNGALAGFLAKWAPEWYISENQVGRHRRRGNPNGCRCPKETGA